MSERWRPSASNAALRARAELLAATRHFFAQRQVLEVETPLVSQAAATDVHLNSMQLQNGRYLHTSPEFAMKRLLAAGSGPIYQICKVFREGEAGARHNPEFTMLEWYRPGLDLAQLKQEVRDLVTDLIGVQQWRSYSYRELFLREFDLDPHQATDEQIANLGVAEAGGELADMRRSDWLDMLMSQRIEPSLGPGAVFVADFPACQAALSQVETDDYGDQVARRFELYVNGTEVANAYLELLDAGILAGRIEQDQLTRQARDLANVPADANLLAAMQAGMPPCSGVALGLDRLLMLRLQADDLADCLSFDWRRA